MDIRITDEDAVGLLVQHGRYGHHYYCVKEDVRIIDGNAIIGDFLFRGRYTEIALGDIHTDFYYARPMGRLILFMGSGDWAKSVKVAPDWVGKSAEDAEVDYEMYKVKKFQESFLGKLLNFFNKSKNEDTR